jgi:AraC-like DNA-binding protein
LQVQRAHQLNDGAYRPMEKRHLLSDIDGGEWTPLAMGDIADKRILFAIKCIEAQKEFDEIAAKLNLSTSRLRHVFKERTGWSVRRFSKEWKLWKAKRILQDTLYTVKETAAIAGFSDLSHFVRDYKSRFGCRPSETRARGQGALATTANE